MRIFEGWARKAALPLLCISAVGWIVYVVGCSLFYQESRRSIPNRSERDEAVFCTVFAPYWIFLVSALLSYIFHFIYLLIGNSLLGLPTNFFTVLSLATGGMVLYNTGFGLASNSFVFSPGNLSIYRETTFAGCLIAELFLGISVLLWLFYIVSPPELCINLTEEDRRAFSGRHSHSSLQPDGSFQQPTFTQLAPPSAFPQAIVTADISSVQQQLNSMKRLVQAMAEHQGIPVEGQPDQRQ